MNKAMIAATVSALALAVGLSPAHGSKGGTQVADLVAERFQGDPNAPTVISGRVVSKRAACEKARRVDAYHDVLPPGPGAEDFHLGSDTTDKDGRFSISTPFVPDQVYVVVSRKKTKRLKCKAAASKTVPVGSYK